jgi:peptidoglycan hydrolase FlgJ
MMPSTSPDLYLNMSQFSDLKLAAKEHDAAAAKTVAQQFEGLFIQMMLKNMRAAAKVDDAQHSSYMDFYTDMYDKQLSQIMSRQGGIGIASMLQRQLDPTAAQRQDSATETGNDLPVYRLQVQQQASAPITVEQEYQARNPEVQVHELVNPLAQNTQVAESSVEPEAASTPLQMETIEPFYGWDQADSFVQDLWPHAQQAAEQLGISTEVLVAQAALETGWGQHSMKKPDGSVAFNLFGIKAGSDWPGQRVSQSTLEFRQGSMQREQASFRAYDSVSEAMQDYVDFVKSSPRYQQALDHQGSDSRYIRGLHQGGYATDPEYADKIINIRDGKMLSTMLHSLPSSDSALS